MRVISVSLYEPVLGVPKVDHVPSKDNLRFTTPPVAVLPLMVQDSDTVAALAFPATDADKAVGAVGGISVLSMTITLNIPPPLQGPQNNLTLVLLSLCTLK